jgi:flagellar biosynthesis/type III secretory pathway protein FliH
MAASAEEITARAMELMAEAWQPALEQSHRLGWENGYRRGYQDGKNAEAEGWMAAIGLCRDTLKQPNHAEILAARLAESKCICGRCSGCVRRENVERNRGRFGQDDYPGRG